MNSASLFFQYGSYLPDAAIATLRKYSMDEAIKFWADFEARAVGISTEAHRLAMRSLALSDRFYLLVRILGRVDALHPWLYARCREVEATPDGYLDLWARNHYKSTIITFAGIIQELLRDPEITIGLFSHTRPIAGGFYKQIRAELERNELLKATFPDVLYADPRKDSPRWNDEGLIVKRLSNPKEDSLSSWGLIDGQPTSKHFKLRVYDDIVTRENVTTPEQVQKTTEALALSDNLGMIGGREWYIGTRYGYGDTYQAIIDREAVKVRIYPATENGLREGKPVFLSVAEWEKKKRTQTPSSLACQMLQNPSAGSQAMFDVGHLKAYEIRPRTLNVYICVDPAGSKKKGSDKTAMIVWGIDAGGNKYLLDGYHHRMRLNERWTALAGLYKYWLGQSGVQSVTVGYERYGMQSDIEHFESEMEKPNQPRFEIHELAWPREGGGSKIDRMERLYPDFAQGRVYLPAVILHGGKLKVWRIETDDKGVTHIKMDLFTRPTSPMQRVIDSGSPDLVCRAIKRTDEDRQAYDVTLNFMLEYRVVPFGQHDDIVDAASRIYDLDVRKPVYVEPSLLAPTVYFDS